MRDYLNCEDFKVVIPTTTVTDNTAIVSSIFDMQGLDGAELVIVAGSLADADATFTLQIDGGEDSGLSDAAADPDEALLGTEALASFTFADDNKVRKIGFRDGKRYRRATITPANNTGSATFTAVLVKHPLMVPTANPPV